MNCNVAVVWMHDYLDGDLPREDAQELKNHLHSCPACLARFEQLEKTEAMMLGTLEHTVSIPDYDKSALTDRIMAQLPKPAKTKERRGVLRFIYKYPGLTAAALFVLVMLGSFTSIWEQDSKLIVSGEDLQQVVINGNTVTVPEGAHVKGNLVVENGTADVKGEVDGNVTVIDGSLNLASTGYIAGQSRTIDQALDWFWYKVTETFSGLAS